MSSENVKSDINEETFPQRCGSVFMTIERNLVFLCTLCEVKYNGFGEYVAHLGDHFPPPDSDSIEKVQIKDEDKCSLEVSLDDGVFEEAEISICEISDLLNANEETSSAESFDDGNNRNEDIRVNVSSTETIVNTQTLAISETNECRPVRKKVNYLRPPDEIRKYKCEICPAAFKDSSSLRKHVVRHSTQKSHQCPQCAKKFYTPIDVKKHLRVHTGERPFLCTICGITCLSSFKLKDHMRRHTNQRDYKCSYCEKAFYNSGLLTEHMEVHSNKRRHKCSVCSAHFTYRKGLRNHMKLHENKRDYKCDLCLASFNQQAGLFSHMKNKHKTALKH